MDMNSESFLGQGKAKKVKTFAEALQQKKGIVMSCIKVRAEASTYILVSNYLERCCSFSNMLKILMETDPKKSLRRFNYSHLFICLTRYFLST